MRKVAYKKRESGSVSRNGRHYAITTLFSSLEDLVGLVFLFPLHCDVVMRIILI